MGHVLQSTALANVMRTDGEILFLTKSNSAVVDEIRKAAFDAIRLENDVEILRHLAKYDPDITIFDKIDVAEDLVCRIRDTLPTGLSIFTNLTDANRYADIAVRADIGSQFKNVVYTDRETNTRYYFGPKYWIMRPQFYVYKKVGKPLSQTVSRLLLIFGGSDPTNLTTAALEELLKYDSNYEIDVIIGAQFGFEQSLYDLLAKHPEKSRNVSIYKNIRNVAELMHRCDVTISSPGLSTFESLMVGTPVLVMPHNDLQRDVYNGFMAMIERPDVASLGSAVKQRAFTYPDESHIREMEIGEGVQELRKVILESARIRA